MTAVDDMRAALEGMPIEFGRHTAIRAALAAIEAELAAKDHALGSWLKEEIAWKQCEAEQHAEIKRLRNKIAGYEGQTCYACPECGKTVTGADDFGGSGL